MDKKTYTNIEPNIWKHNTEQKYVIDIFLGRDENGKQQRTTKTYYSLKEAREGLVLAKAKKINGVAKTKVKTPTIYELMSDYRKTYISTNNEETTSYGYSVIENHIKNFFESTGKNTRVDKITATTINQYYRYLADLRTKRLPNGMSANTIRKHNNYLHQLFVYAKKHVDVYGIRVNPVEDSTPPKKVKAKTPDLKAYNTDKIAEMLECLDKNNDIALKAAVMVGFFVGTRRGETDYLKWSDIDLQTKRIQIKGSRTCSNKVVIKDTTKTNKDRETSLSDLLIETLKEYKKWQEHNAEILGDEYFKSDYFLVRSDGRPYYPRWISRKFPEFLAKYNLPHIRYHDLRHLNASVLLMYIPVTDVSEHLGHSNTNTTTRIYAHSLMKEKNKVADTMDNIFKVG